MPCYQCSFIEAEVFGIFVEISFCCGLYAVCAPPKVDGIHVIARYSILILGLCDFQGRERFPSLSRKYDLVSPR